MKKITQIVLSFLLILVLFSSCGKDNNSSKNNSNSPSSPIVGYWILKSDTEFPHLEKYFPHTGDNKYQFTFIYNFTNDGKFEVEYLNGFFDEFKSYKFNCKYTVEENTFTLTEINQFDIIATITGERVEELWADESQEIAEWYWGDYSATSESYEFTIDGNTLTITKTRDGETRTQVLCKCTSDGTLI